jgi:hypothetical protein
MKKLLFSSFALIGIFAASVAFGADKESKEITIKGDGKCGKCALKETDSCQNVIQVDKGKNKGTYYLVQNDISKNFHDNICKETKKVKATGSVKEADGKKEFTATKIEVVE